MNAREMKAIVNMKQPVLMSREVTVAVVDLATQEVYAKQVSICDDS